MRVTRTISFYACQARMTERWRIYKILNSFDFEYLR